MYSQRAKELRRCEGKRKDGQPCNAWALWDDPRQLCVSHAGWHHKGLRDPNRSWRSWSRTRYKPCNCIAYNWPHRPGGGVCNWPDPPQYKLTTPAGTHQFPSHWRRSGFSKMLRLWKRRYD